MREIKFRGKSVNTGEWVHGYHPFSGCADCSEYLFGEEYFEIIGNIHDNPELLESE